MNFTLSNLNGVAECLPTLAQWHHQQWSYLNPGQSLQVRINRMAKCLGEALIPSTVVALQKGKPLGSASIVASDMDSHPELTPWLASVYVAPEFRGQGLGSALVKDIMQSAKLDGVKTLYLFTPDQQVFYQRLGWETYSEESYRGVSVTIMQCELF